MNLSLFIAKRYLIAKKSHNIINIISLISLSGIVISTMALVIVLSVFNGFEKLVTSLFSTFNPEIQITLKEGKIFSLDKNTENQIRKIQGVVYYNEVIEENALLKYNSNQFIVRMKGVSNEYTKMSRMDTMLVEGKFLLEHGSNDFAIIGAGVASRLGIDLKNSLNSLTVYVPRTGNNFSLDPSNAFNSENILPTGIFSVQQDIDNKYILFPLRFARKLLDYTNQVTSVELKLDTDADVQNIKSEIQKIIGNKFEVKDRFQQQELLYKIMKSEKLSIFLILSFILFIATVNIIGTLTLLILDKKKDISILTSLGADRFLIKKIFISEGMMIAVIGTVTGIALGCAVCLLQQHFSMVKFPQGTFIIQAYPVEIQLKDLVIVFSLVIMISFLAVRYPVRRVSKMLKNQCIS